MRRDTQAVLLLLVGATLLKVGFSGTYVRYVKPGALPLLLIGGAALVFVAGVTLWQQFRAAPPPPETAESDRDDALVRSGHGPTAESAVIVRAEAAGRAAAAHEGFDPEPVEPDPPAPPAAAESDDRPDDAQPHEDGHDRSRVGWLLLVPALALLVFSPPALGSFQATRNGTALSIGSTSDFAPLPAGDPVRVTLLDYASRAVFDQGRSLNGRTVLLTGFVITGPHGEPYLARMFVGCCAADGRPVKIGLTGDLPGDLIPETWIEVTGTYTDQADRDLVNGEVIPYVSAVAVHAIQPPQEPYET
jgi:uncharacterized repeat protein (TIGR03943 family)